MAGVDYKTPTFKKRADYLLRIWTKKSKIQKKIRLPFGNLHFNLNFTDIICHPMTIFSIGIRTLKIDQNELSYKYEQRTVIPLANHYSIDFQSHLSNIGRKIIHNIQVKYSSQRDRHRKVYFSRLIGALRFARCFKKSACHLVGFWSFFQKITDF